MGGPEDTGGTYSSIDPAALKGAADDLKKSADGITGKLWPLRKEFLSYGVSTGHLDKLHGFAQTLTDMTPELYRRHSLASQMLLENPSMGKVATFQGDLLGPFKTTAEAQAQAKKDAAKLSKDGMSDETLANMEKYGMDPDYAEALVKELGPKGMRDVLFTQDRVDDDPDTRASKALSNWLATASYKHPFDKEYLDKVRDEAGVEFPLEMFKPYLTHGTWSEKTLTNFADLRFKAPTGDKKYSLDYDQSLTQNLLKGLSNNPTAAANYFNANHDLMYDSMRAEGDPGKYQVGSTSDRWAEFVQAATVTSRNGFGTKYLKNPGDNPAVKNAEWMMKKVSGDDVDWKGKMRVSFANISAEYMDDYAYTVGSPLDVGKVHDPGHDGVSVNTKDWQGFLKAGMSDNTGMLIIAASMKKKIDSLKESATLGEANSPSDNADGWFWDKYTAGAMQDTFVGLYGQVGADRKKSEKDQENAINGLFDKGLDYATDPTGIVKDVGKTAIKELTHLAVGAAIDSKPLPKMPTGFDVKQNFADEAVTRLQTDKPFKKFDDGDVKWDGDPKLYTWPSPPNADFTDEKFMKNGKMDYDALAKDPAAWSSFNNWLHDPAVQVSIADGYKTELLGSHESD